MALFQFLQFIQLYKIKYKFCRAMNVVRPYNIGTFSLKWLLFVSNAFELLLTWGSIHLQPLIWGRVAGEQLQQGDPDFPLFIHFVQLFRCNPKASACQPWDVAPLACAGSSPGPPPGTCPERLTRENAKQMPEPLYLAPVGVKEKWLYSESLPDDRPCL